MATLLRPEGFGRRQFLQTVSGMVVGACYAAVTKGEDLPTNINPRAISGDPVEPEWTERISVTVGEKEGDLVGTTDRVIQAAVDYLGKLGGGTVRIGPGTYRLRNSIFLRSKVRLVGSGADSVL